MFVSTGIKDKQSKLIRTPSFFINRYHGQESTKTFQQNGLCAAAEPSLGRGSVWHHLPRPCSGRSSVNWLGTRLLVMEMVFSPLHSSPKDTARYGPKTDHWNLLYLLHSHLWEPRDKMSKLEKLLGKWQYLIMEYKGKLSVAPKWLTPF